MANSKRKCANCKNRFKAETMYIHGTQAFCSKESFIEYSIKNKAKLVVKGKKIQDKIHSCKKENIKTLSTHKKELQTIFNKWIRLTDKNEPCISCQRHHQGQYHAGHYLSVGAAPELRFEPDNCHKQCAPCNNHLSGNPIKYRVNLINKIGLERVEWLEGPHEPKKYTIDQIKGLKVFYKLKIKQLEQDLAA